MKKALVLVCVLCVVSASVLAAPLAVYPVKDSGMPGHDSENNSSTGADNSDRIAKDYQHCGAYDFDANPVTNAALADWLTAEGVTPTVAGMVSAINANTIAVQLRIAQVGTGLNGIKSLVRTIDCAVDWTEGDGTSWSNFNWTSGTLAATNRNPNQVHPDDGPALGVGWGLAENTSFTGASYTESSGFIWHGPVADSYSYITLDAEIVRQLAEETTNRGLYTFTSWGDGANNGAAYFSEQSGTGLDPHLSFVPEPMTLGLLVVGGLGVLIRRKRR